MGLYKNTDGILSPIAGRGNISAVWQSNSVLGAKNLIPYPYHRASGYSSNGVTATYDEEGVITVNKVAGSATAYFALFSSILFPDAKLFLAPNTEYILSMELEDAVNTSCFIQATNGVDLAAIRNKGTGKYEVAFTTPKNLNFTALSLYWGSDVVETNAKVKVMLRLASDQDDTYQPYAMTNRELTDYLKDDQETSSIIVRKFSGITYIRIPSTATQTAAFNAIANAGLISVASGGTTAYVIGFKGTTPFNSISCSIDHGTPVMTVGGASISSSSSSAVGSDITLMGVSFTS